MNVNLTGNKYEYFKVIENNVVYMTRMEAVRLF